MCARLCVRLCVDIPFVGGDMCVFRNKNWHTSNIAVSFIYSRKCVASTVREALIISPQLSMWKPLSTITEPKYMSEGPYSQLAVGEALWSLALISLSIETNISEYHFLKNNLINDTCVLMKSQSQTCGSELSELYLWSDFSLWWQNPMFQLNDKYNIFPVRNVFFFIWIYARYTIQWFFPLSYHSLFF